MKIILKGAAICFAIISVIHITSRDALAYLDPGTGSYIMQLLLGIFLGALFTMKVFWGKIKAFFRSDKDSSE